MEADRYSEDYRISRLLTKYLGKTLTFEEEKELQDWLGENENNRILFGGICSAENMQERENFIRQLDMSRAWKQTRVRMGYSFGKARRWWRWTSVAAAIALFIGISLIYSNPEFGELPVQTNRIESGDSKAVLITPYGQRISLYDCGKKKQWITLKDGTRIMNDGKKVTYSQTMDSIPHLSNNVIQVPRGGEFELILPDKTHVWLNAETEISFPTKFKPEFRLVTLKGEAFFDVAKDPESPFLVQTGENLTIRVLGTQFNVQSYPDDHSIETTLCEGAVLVSDGKQDVRLLPNQQAVYHIREKRLSSGKVNAGQVAAWKDGKFIFENASLESIMNRLCRWYDIQVVYVHQQVRNFHFTGDLERYDDFNKTLRMLEKATNIQFEMKGKTVLIREVSR